MGSLADKLLQAQAAAQPPPPDVPPGGEAVGSIVFEPLDLAVHEPPPDMLIDDLVYVEGVHLLSGHPGCGKTTIAQHMAHMTMADDRHVVWLDYEAGKRQTKRRMQALGIDATMATKYFHYAPFPTQSEQHLLALATRWPSALVVLDSFSKALADAGISEDDNSEVTQFTVQVVKACKRAALPVVIIDHITKQGDESLYSRGAGAKLADVDVHWRVLKREDFNRSQSGLIQLKQKKDREACLPFESWWKIGDGAGALTITSVDGPPSDDAPTDPDGTMPSI